MRTVHFIVAVLASGGIIAAGDALARERHGQMPSFESIDTDADGAISRAEMEAVAAARLARIDTDGDGLLSQDELASMGHQRADRRAEMMISRLDRDQDGKLSVDELRERRNRVDLFARADVDSDGVVSRAEFDAVQVPRQGKHGERSRDN